MRMYLTYMRKLLHWGPILALTLIKIVTTMTIYGTNLWWPIGESFASTINMLVLISLAFFTVYTFLNAVFIGPGYVPLAWIPEQSSDEKYMQFCVTCAGFKVPRSHHCHKCGRCVLKMDHHCPWINNCVGHFNHLYFVLFLISAICGCFHSLWLLFVTVVKFLNRSWYYYHGIRPPVLMSLFPVLMCLLSIGIAFGVMVSLCFLLYIQMKAIIKNQTGIEEWIVDKANERRNNDPTLKPFRYPYDLGRYNNFRQVFSWNLVGDGITWNVAEGFTQYDLTIEQKEQKALKKMRILPYQVIRHYNGSSFPFVHGFGTLCHPPCTLEARIPLRPHDIVFVSRMHDYWMFGEKFSLEMKSKCKGWFPKACVVPASEKAINKLKVKNL